MESNLRYLPGIGLLTKAIMVIYILICLDMIIEGITGRCCIWWNMTKTKDIKFPSDYGEGR
jgi:hypothetical protein